MDKLMREYREKHKKCKWCKYYKYHNPMICAPWISCPDYETCELKGKEIYFTDSRVFCKYYIVKEGK